MKRLKSIRKKIKLLWESEGQKPMKISKLQEMIFFDTEQNIMILKDHERKVSFMRVFSGNDVQDC